MEPTLLRIEDGIFGLTIVDKAAVGYADAWQAPGGATAATAALDEYADDAATWTCQITSGRLSPSKQVNRQDRAATFCSPASSTPQAGQTTYALDVSFFQDADVRAGLSAFLYEHDTEHAYFLLGAGPGLAAPRAIGRCIVVAGGFLGDPQANLTDTISLDVVRKPDILFGRTGSTRLITGTGTVTDDPT
jgi:hypothetical protein